MLLSPQPLVELLEDRIAPATLVNPYTVTYTDEDGDLATVKLSKPLFTSLNVNVVLDFNNGTVDGSNATPQQLQTINLQALAFAPNVNIAITAKQQADTNGQLHGNNQVDVGYIRAGTFSNNQVNAGLDLGAIRIGGDLGRIDVGDNNTLPAIQSLTVLSMGARGTATQDASDASLISHIQGLAGVINVLGDVKNGASINLVDLPGKVGTGSVGTLRIVGSLIGSTAANSGQVHFTGTIFNGVVGSIDGGAGAGSGAIIGEYGTLSKINNLTITGVTAANVKRGITGGGGQDSGEVAASRISNIVVKADVKGGAGNISGLIQASSLDHVTISGSLIGGSGANSGELFGDRLGRIAISGDVQGGTAGTASAPGNTGFISASISAASIAIGGSLKGGNAVSGNAAQTANSSGAISINGGLGSLLIHGDVTGGTGNSSGMIFTVGKLGSARILGNFIGGNANASTQLVNSGYLEAGHLSSLFIGANVQAGSNAGTGGVDSAGVIRSRHEIGSLVIGGKLQGNAIGNNPAIISAVGQESLSAGTTIDLAIRSVVIGGDMDRAEILAGYNTDTSGQTLARGTPINADASIGTVRIGGNMTASSIVAGATPGSDTFFGDTNDARISGANVLDRASIISKISSVIVFGHGLGTASPTDPDHFGIVAQQVVSVNVNGSPIPLTAGASNDFKPIGDTLGTSTGTPDSHDFHVVEVV